MQAYSAEQLRSDLATAFLMAVGISMIAAIAFAIGGVVNVLDLIRGKSVSTPWRTYLLSIIVVLLSYCVAAAAAGLLAFILRPARRSIVGWAVTGAAISAAIYGSVGVTIAVFFDPVGAFFLEHTTREEAWSSIPGFLEIMAPVGAVVGVYWWWRDRHGRPFA
jgi:hypothetical protein